MPRESCQPWDLSAEIVAKLPPEDQTWLAKLKRRHRLYQWAAIIPAA